MAKRKSEISATNAKKEKIEEDFTLKTLKAKEGNQIFSPINIAHAFGILLHGAEGATKKEIANILGYGESRYSIDLIENNCSISKLLQSNDHQKCTF